MSLNSSVVTTPQVGSNTHADPTYTSEPICSTGTGDATPSRQDDDMKTIYDERKFTELLVCVAGRLQRDRAHSCQGRRCPMEQSGRDPLRPISCPCRFRGRSEVFVVDSRVRCRAGAVQVPGDSETPITHDFDADGGRASHWYISRSCPDPDTTLAGKLAAAPTWIAPSV